MGHYSAARSLAQLIEGELPHSQIQVVDFLSTLCRSCPAPSIRGLSCWSTGGLDFTTGYTTSPTTAEPETVPSFSGIFWERWGTYLSHQANRYPLHPAPLLPAGQLLQAPLLDSLPLVTCITDVTSHSEWINDFTDYYLRPVPLYGGSWWQGSHGGTDLRRRHPGQAGVRSTTWRSPSPGRHLLGLWAAVWDCFPNRWISTSSWTSFPA